MIKKRTVFILGAGASCPYGFPDGSELRRQICRSFVGELEKLLAADKRWSLGMSNPLSEARAFVTAFDSSPPQSIDLFLSRNPRYSRIGKVAILLNILGAERSSRFGDKAEHLEMDWYSRLFAKLTEDLSRQDDFRRFGRNARNVSFITFNYDRSLEHFLYDGLCHSFSEAAHNDQTARVLDMMSPIHVYGRLAPLDWQGSPDSSSSGLPYGASPQEIDGAKLIDNLVTVYEAKRRLTDEDASFDIELNIEEAEVLFFLGFGYAEENLKALGLPRVLKPQHLVYGTAFRRTAREIDDIRTFFVHGLQQSARAPADWPANVQERVQIRDCDSTKLLHEFL